MMSKLISRFGFSIIIGAWLAMLAACSPEEKTLQLGKPIHTFVADTIYKAMTDGFLKVVLIYQSPPFQYGDPSGWVYSDENAVPKLQAAIVYTSSTTTIEKYNYWILKPSNPNNTYLITWTPLEYK